MKILKRITWVIFAIPVFVIWMIAVCLGPFAWIITGDEASLANAFATHSAKLSNYLKGE